MIHARRHTLHRQQQPVVALERLEDRQLMSSGFRPEGPVISSPASAPSAIVTADLNGDGRADLLTAVGKTIRFQPGLGAGRFGAARTVATFNADAGLLGVGDFNADGKADIVSVQRSTAFGWRRVLLNSGDARFVGVSFARSATIVESLTVGNIDSDPEPEVLVQGFPSTITLADASIVPVGLANQEIRVLDAIFLRTFAADTSGLPGGELTSDERRLLAAPGGATPVRLFDRGVGVSAPGLGRPAIADVVGAGTGNIVVVGRSGTDANSGFVQVYAFAEASLAVFPPSPLFVDRGERIALVGEATSVGVADFDRDGQGDLVVTTLLSSTSQPPPGGGITASTLRLLRSGGDATPRFAAPTVIDSRVLTGPGGGGFTQTPEYRIATTADLNADGSPDVGLSIVSESIPPTARGATRQADFVQLLSQPAPDLGPGYAASFVVRQFVSGLPTEQAYARVQMFLAAGLRGVGRPDLIYVEQASGSGVSRLRILLNVRTPTAVPLA